MSAARLCASALVLCLLAGAAVARAETAQSGNLRVEFEGKLSPHALPRSSRVPVQVSVGAKILTADGSPPPKLQRMKIAINRYGRLESRGMPKCPLSEIQPATNAAALAHCRGSLVGHGEFSANVLYENPDEAEAPFPSRGKVYAFNAEYRGRPAILAHVYGTLPGPTSYTIPFVISRAGGTFGVTLTADLPEALLHTGYVTGISLTLGATYYVHGKRRLFLSASCPTPAGVAEAPYQLARGSFFFNEAPTLTQSLTRSCRARG